MTIEEVYNDYKKNWRESAACLISEHSDREMFELLDEVNQEVIWLAGTDLFLDIDVRKYEYTELRDICVLIIRDWLDILEEKWFFKS